MCYLQMALQQYLSLILSQKSRQIHSILCLKALQMLFGCFITMMKYYTTSQEKKHQQQQQQTNVYAIHSILVVVFRCVPLASS